MLASFQFSKIDVNNKVLKFDLLLLVFRGIILLLLEIVFIKMFV